MPGNCALSLTLLPDGATIEQESKHRAVLRLEQPFVLQEVPPMTADTERTVQTFVLDGALDGAEEGIVSTLAIPRGARVFGVERHGPNDLLLSVFVDVDIAGTELRTFLTVRGRREDLIKETVQEAPGTPVGSVGLPGHLMARTYETNGISHLQTKQLC